MAFHPKPFYDSMVRVISVGVSVRVGVIRAGARLRVWVSVPQVVCVSSAVSEASLLHYHFINFEGNNIIVG